MTEAGASSSPSSTARLKVVPWKYFWPKYASQVSACASSSTSAERAVPLRERAQLGERDRVVAAERHGEDARLDHRHQSLDSTCAYVRSVSPGDDRQVAVVDDRKRVDDVHIEDRVVGADQRRGRADRLGAEASAGADSSWPCRRESRRRAASTPARSVHVRRAHVRADAREPRDELRVERAGRAAPPPPYAIAGELAGLREAEVDLRGRRVGPARGDDLAARVEVDPLGPVDVRSPKSEFFQPPNE